jgi:hypothetical protein
MMAAARFAGKQPSSATRMNTEPVNSIAEKMGVRLEARAAELFTDFCAGDSNRAQSLIGLLARFTGGTITENQASALLSPAESGGQLYMRLMRSLPIGTIVKKKHLDLAGALYSAIAANTIPRVESSDLKPHVGPQALTEKTLPLTRQTALPMSDHQHVWGPNGCWCGASPPISDAGNISPIAVLARDVKKMAEELNDPIKRVAENAVLIDPSGKRLLFGSLHKAPAFDTLQKLINIDIFYLFTLFNYDDPRTAPPRATVLVEWYAELKKSGISAASHDKILRALASGDQKSGLAAGTVENVMRPIRAQQHSPKRWSCRSDFNW